LMRWISAGVIFRPCMTMIFSMAKTDSTIKTVSPAKNEEQISFLLPSQLNGLYAWVESSSRWGDVPE
jgi:hypothetical protein